MQVSSSVYSVAVPLVDAMTRNVALEVLSVLVQKYKY